MLLWSITFNHPQNGPTRIWKANRKDAVAEQTRLMEKFPKHKISKDITDIPVESKKDFVDWLNEEARKA